MQAVEQILRRTDVAVQAKEFAIYDNKSHFDPIVWEALRFSPFTLFVVRISAAEANIAPGAPHQVLVPKGQAVAACVGSAMFDEAIFPEPNKFVAGRPLQNYLHFGFGHHQCLGKYVGLEVIPEAVRRILQLPGVHLLEGDAGKIDFASGPFPERFEVGLETMLSDRGARRRETPTPARTPNRTRRHKRATPPNPK
jgi:cytochrome P450